MATMAYTNVLTTGDALAALGVRPTTLSDAQLRAFEGDGFFVVEGVLTPDEVRAIADEFDRISAAERDNAGAEVSQEPGATRISNVFNKSAAFDVVMAPPP